MIKNNNNLTISSGDVEDFKTIYCDENKIIKDILRKEYIEYFQGTIVDVGGGTADILSDIIPEKEVIHLDVLDFSNTAIPNHHRRIIGDFLNPDLITSLQPIDTLFMSHVIQFIDSDLQRLKLAIDLAGAQRIIMIEDVNDDFLGEVMRYSLENFNNANPEFKIKDFPYGYSLLKTTRFTAKLIASTFLELTRQCLYLMDLDHTDDNLRKMQEFLESRLNEPNFTINQEVNLYIKS